MLSRRSWQHPLSPAVQAAVLSGDADCKVYNHGGKASLTIVSRGRKSVWDLLRGEDGWTYVWQLDGFVTTDFAADGVSLLDLVGVGLVDVMQVHGRTILASGLISIRHAVDDILCKGATFVCGEWRVSPYQRPALCRLNENIVASLSERARKVAAQRRQRAEDRERRRKEEEAREEEREMRRDAKAHKRSQAMLYKAYKTRMDTREQAAYMHELNRIRDFMKDKPLLFAEWTSEMMRASESHGVRLSLSWAGNERVVNAVYPDPPDA